MKSLLILCHSTLLLPLLSPSDLKLENRHPGPGGRREGRNKKETSFPAKWPLSLSHSPSSSLSSSPHCSLSTLPPLSRFPTRNGTLVLPPGTATLTAMAVTVRSQMHPHCSSLLCICVFLPSQLLHAGC
jgi:hypothetical protein